MTRWTLGGSVALAAALAAGPIAAEDAAPIVLRCGCAYEYPWMLPEEYRERLESRRVVEQTDGTTRRLTPVPVDIDPLGADPFTPWNVHRGPLNVRTGPSTTGTTVLGSLPTGTMVSGVYNLVLESDQEWLSFEFESQSAWISCAYINRVHPTNEANIALHTNLPYNQEIVNRWWGIPITYEPTDLVNVNPAYTNPTITRTYLLRQEVADAVADMMAAARAEDPPVVFWVTSPYRSGAQQKSIYDNNINNSGLAQRFSAPPGHSEHQLGATMDFSVPAGNRFLNNTDPEYLWLRDNGATFGFRQTYTADNIEETGYIEEPWHWRYIGVGATTVGDWWAFE